MKGQSSLPPEIAKYVAAFVEGLFEIVSVTILIALGVGFANALNATNIATQAPNLILEYVGLAFVASIVINFFKGMISPDISAATVLGMIVGIFVFGAAVTAITPEAIPEMISYIIAAIFGIIAGAYLRGQQN